MRPFLRITLRIIGATALIGALIVAAIPIWLLLRVPAVITPPGAGALPGAGAENT